MKRLKKLSLGQYSWTAIAVLSLLFVACNGIPGGGGNTNNSPAQAQATATQIVDNAKVAANSVIGTAVTQATAVAKATAVNALQATQEAKNPALRVKRSGTPCTPVGTPKPEPDNIPNVVFLCKAGNGVNIDIYDLRGNPPGYEGSVVNQDITTLPLTSPPGKGIVVNDTSTTRWYCVGWSTNGITSVQKDNDQNGLPEFCSLS